jgi:hypothetical protein
LGTVARLSAAPDLPPARERPATAPAAINKKPLLFDSSSSCFMAKEAKVLYDESDDESEMEYVHDSDNDKYDNENDDDD